MHSGAQEKVGTPRTRTLSRGMSEDESLRHFIKEAEGSAKRLTRADSRVGSLKKPLQGENQTEEDLTTSCPEMLDLQESYEEVVQELRELEAQRGALLFQVDCLQDALEGAEEMLAEARREANGANEELERERQAKKRLEESVDSLKEMVGALTEEIQRLKEERAVIPTVPVYTLVTDVRLDEEGTAADEEEDRKHERPGELGNDGAEEEPEVAMDALEEANEWVDAPDAPMTVIRLDSCPNPQLQEGEAETTAGGILASFFRKGKEEPAAEGGHPQLHSAHLGSSVDSDDSQAAGEDEGPLTKFQRMFNKTFGQTSPTQEGGPDGAEPVLRLAEGLVGESPTDEPCQPLQMVSAAPELGLTLTQRVVPVQDPEHSEAQGEIAGTPESPTALLPEDLLDRKDGVEPKSPKSPDSCILS